ncbi:MAG: NUDIX domain-containing protein [Lachnospiraceae bacterium]|nr:NUDIX domain-containing protein [Lachnospiraceae bacterium]
MGYIMDLREHVGHAPLLQCAGSIIIENEKGEILLGRRTDNHLWGYAGGSVELGESVEECARRELFEETGLTAGKMELFMVNSGPETHYIYPNGDEVYNVEIIYLCRDYTGEPKRQEEEIDELRFFAPEEISLEMISPPIRPVFRRFLEAVNR